MNHKTMLCACLAACLAACSATRVNLDSSVAVPAQFEEAASAQGAAEVAQWWQAWPDPVLRQLIETGLRHNRNLAAMRANVAAARANAALVAADLGPNVALSGGAGAHNVDVDNPINSDVRSVLSKLGSPLGEDSHRAQGHQTHIGFAARWEPDIFGGKRSDADAAHYASLGVLEQWHGAQLLLATDIADNYLRMRALQQRMRIGRQSVATLQQLQRYAAGRFQAGQATDYDVRDVAAKLSAVQAQLATLQAQADAYERNLAVLSGVPAQDFRVPATAVDILAAIPAAPAGQMPLAVLNRRPDVRTQEHAVKAMSAKLASAKADLLPRFDLTFLWQSGRIRLDSDVPQLKGLGGLVSAGVTLPIFTSGRIQRNIEAADARLQAALAQYDQSVLQALAEVDSSYQLQYSLNRQSRLLAAALHQAQAQAGGAEKLFRYGNMTLDRALSARLNAEDLADKQVQGRLAEAQNLLNVYKALGGGWSEDGVAVHATSAF